VTVAAGCRNTGAQTSVGLDVIAIITGFLVRAHEPVTADVHNAGRQAGVVVSLVLVVTLLFLEVDEAVATAGLFTGHKTAVGVV